ncbi:metal ABC transporter substrate-binding protein [Roseibium denhamense]|uniref:Zinc/manganese transport system substrate-binding protein n=1 Tax=Roseibium denhamense TaxID=76305 RepID=A0ABY1P937_9HYPH|nr:zinc ABC transporter substrate-binding protein [Roseibium denhamense]MTI07367.1 metal ABC transporter substrate-binding protein [Roseibium denhamense]SMP29131.1 zinc/manganese transport system substrate-binding protein [Roseibium denhamense]
MTFLKTLAAGFAASSLMLAALPASAHDDIKVVASFSILGDMVEQVVGGHASVTTIVGPDADAHVYQPSVADAKAVAESDVIFVNGLGFETWSDTLISESGTEATVHVATEGVTPVRVDGEIDPHAWNSLSNGVIYVRNIADAMSAVLPDHADDFKANADAYIAQLEALDAETRQRLAALPEDRRTVVTAHDAFGYLADAYGMTFLAPVGIDTEAEPSARDLAVLIAQLKDQGAAALFVENITSPALVQQISDETGIEIGGRLFSDALSERGGPATSYLAMFQHNLGTLLDALGKKVDG